MALKKNARVPRKRAQTQPVKRVLEADFPVKKIKKRKALVIAQEIKFARLLANNDKKVRDKMLKNLKKWLTVRSESSFAFTEADFMRLWKGLFYCMWMSDKPLVQEELAESLSNIVHCFDSAETALLYTKCTLRTLAVEWFGIDRYRLDKFQMLVRRIIRQTFEMCRRRSWDEEWTKGTASVIETLLLDPKTTLGFSLHLTELYMEELAKIGGETILPHLVTKLLRPFAIHLASMEDERQIRHVMKHIFRYLIFQSDVGMDYMDKFQAWREAGFPCKNIDDMQKIELSDEESMDEDENTDKSVTESRESKALDPRAGRVDVELPQLPFDPLAIAELIKQYKFHPKSTTKTRRQIMRLIREFSELAKGNMPLGVKEILLPQRKNPETNPKKAAYRLLEFEKELYSDNIRRKRKRKLALPVDDDNEGFENVYAPTLSEEHEENGFQDALEPETDDDDDGHTEMSQGKAVGETVHNSASLLAKSNKKLKKSLPQQTAVPSTNAILKTAGQKQHKKQKKEQHINEKLRNVAEEEKQSVLGKSIKIKNKKSKTKKLQSAINYLNKKFLNRSSDEPGTPTKVKKSRLSIEPAWDVSNNQDPPTPTVSPTSKVSTKSRAPEKSITNVTSDVDVKEPLATPTKDQLAQIPWLLPVITKLEDEKSAHTPNKTQPEVKGSGSSTKKRVKIVLQNNTAQHTSEYIRQLRRSSAIPYDANRKPLSSVLKPSPLSSPVNPFYKNA